MKNGGFHFGDRWHAVNSFAPEDRVEHGVGVVDILTAGKKINPVVPCMKNSIPRHRYHAENPLNPGSGLHLYRKKRSARRAQDVVEIGFVADVGLAVIKTRRLVW